MVERSDDIAGAAVFDFLAAYLADRDHGEVRPLSDYLARFRGQEEAIAREYFALAAPAPEAPSDRVGPYRVVREIGRGGQGVVLLAEDTRIARRVALKVLATSFSPATSLRRVERFRREAEVIARLEHPSLCAIYEADVEGPVPYIAMRYVEGPTLAEVLARARLREERDEPGARDATTSRRNVAGTRELDARRKTDARETSRSQRRDPDAAALSGSRSGALRALEADIEHDADTTSTRWPPRDALALRAVLLYFERAARALHAAHEAGVVHRDVKPGNLIVAADETPVILDFGLARDDASELASLTDSGELFGTPAYMSPEQLDRPSDELDRRTDVYSLGVTLYEALTLQRPFDAPARAALYAQIAYAPAPDVRARNPVLSEDVRVVVETALEKDPARRYATALDLAEDLRRIRAYEPIRARPASAGLRFARWTRRHPALAISIGGTMLALAAGLALALVLLARVGAERNEKELALRAKDDALEVALGRHLAGRAVALVPQDPALALALAIEAAELEIAASHEPELGANYLTRSALFQALDACRMRTVLSGEPARLVTDLALAPGDDRIAIGLEDDEESRIARVFDFESGRPLHYLTAAHGSATRLAWSPDATRIASASKDGRLRLFDARDGTLLAETDAEVELGPLAFDPTATRLLLVARDSPATLRDAASLLTIAVLGARAGEIEEAHFVLGGRRVVSRAGSGDPSAALATVWDAHTGLRLADLAGHEGPITWLDVAADATVVTGGLDGAVRIWDAGSAREIAAPLLHAGPVTFATIDAGARHVLTTREREEDVEVRLWRVADATFRRLEGHRGRKLRDAAFSPDGTHVATAGEDTILRVFDVATGELRLEIKTLLRPSLLRWSADGRELATMSVGARAHVWFAGERPDVFALRGHAAAVRRVSFSPDGTRALTASDDGTARVWALPVAGSQEREHEPGAPLQVFHHAGALTSARFDAHGTSVLTTARDGTARVWDATTGVSADASCIDPAGIESGDFVAGPGRVLTLSSAGGVAIHGRDGGAPPLVLELGAAPASCARVDPTGELVVTAGDEDRLRVWDARSGACLRELLFERLAARQAGVVDVAFLPDGREIAVACRDYKLRFFDVQSAEATRPDVFVSMHATLRVAPDGGRLLLLGERGGASAKVLDLATGGSRFAEIQHTDDITDGAFSADGRLVVTSSRDGTVHVWDAESGRPVAHRAARGSAVLAVAFDGGATNPRVIAALEDGRVSVWPVDPLPAARARRPRDLSPLEKAREQRLALPLVYE